MQSFEPGYRSVPSSPRVPLHLRRLPDCAPRSPTTFEKLGMFTNVVIVSFLLKSHFSLLHSRQMSVTSAAPLLFFSLRLKCYY
jgi:hypothetical protein